MKNEQLYKETVDIILDAYNERKLEHGHPCGCFIGNIIAERGKIAGLPAGTISNDYYYDVKEWLYRPDWWYHLIAPMKHPHSPLAHWHEAGSQEEGLRQVQLTGYTSTEVLSLEEAFESENSLVDEDGKIGMTKALNRLAEIHETEATESIERLEKIHKEVYECV